MDSLGLPERCWLWAAAICYAVAFSLAVASVLRKRPHSRTVLFAIVAFGFLLQTVGLYARGITVGRCPLGNKFEIIQFLVWSATVLYLFIGPVFRLTLLGFFTSGLATLLAFISLLVPSWDSARRESLFSDNPWIEFHAAIGILSYGAFGLLAITSAMYILQNFSLKKRRLRLLWVGLALLTLSLGVGYYYFLQNQEAVDPIKLRTIGLVWIGYVLILVLRQVGVLRSRLLAWTCIFLFGLVLLTLGPVSKSGQDPKVAHELLSE
jgi:ABC-type transport system involved in cytochrome c biogenesis permease subunit